MKSLNQTISLPVTAKADVSRQYYVDPANPVCSGYGERASGGVESRHARLPGSRPGKSLVSRSSDRPARIHRVPVPVLDNARNKQLGHIENGSVRGTSGTSSGKMPSRVVPFVYGEARESKGWEPDKNAVRTLAAGTANFRPALITRRPCGCVRFPASGEVKRWLGRLRFLNATCISTERDHRSVNL